MLLRLKSEQVSTGKNACRVKPASFWPLDWSVHRSGRSRKIAIIGAGISGLVSAWLLKRAGHDVVVFEASKTVGGRIKTLRAPFSTGLFAEAGAMRIPAHHRLTIGLAGTLGLDLVPYRNSCENALVHLNGQRVTLGRLRQDPQRLGFALEDRERGLTARDLFEGAVLHYLRSGGGFARLDAAHLFNAEGDSDDLKPVFERLDHFSLGTFLRQASGLSAAAVDFILAILSLEAHQTSSMAAIVGDHRELTTSTTFWRVKGGMDRLASAFVASPSGGPTSLADKVAVKPNLSAEVHFEARLTHLLNSPKGISLRIEQPTTRDSREIGPFDRVVLSAPFSALRHVRFDGLASPGKRRAIRCLHYDNSCKILLEFDDCFWQSRMADPIRGGNTITDLPVRAIHYPSQPADGEPSERAVLLASYTWADDSLRWGSLHPDERVRFTLRDLEEVHDLSPGSLDRCFTGGTSYTWLDQGYGSGAVAMFEPHQMTTLFEDVRRPEGLLHYCGEHTSRRHGWIEGAIESALRVSAEVCEAIDNEAHHHRAYFQTGGF